MTQQDKEQLKLEIDHIFESGANELRIYEMVINFINSRNAVNKNFVLADVISSGKSTCPKCHDRGWLYDDLGNRAGTCSCHY
jgi:hypothetical protein